MRVCLTLAALLATAAVAAVASKAPTHRAAPAPRTLRIYSSLPLHASRGNGGTQARDALRGARLALAEAGATAGGHPITLVSLDDSSPSARRWDADSVIENALRAAMDGHAIAYLGEFNSAASAISIQFLNEAGLLQVSPSNTYVGLTRREGAEVRDGEPNSWYPTGVRTYGRVAPADHLQAAAIATLLASLRVERVLLVDNGEQYGAGIAAMVRRRARARGVTVLGPSPVRSSTRMSRLVRRARADAMVFSGLTDDNAIQIFNAAHRDSPDMTLIGTAGVAESPFTRHLGAGTAQRTLIMDPALPNTAYTPTGKAFVEAFTTRYGRSPGRYGIFGYEAMKVILAAIDKGRGDRTATVDAFFATRNRDSVLGRYSIDSKGDTTLSTYGVWRVHHGEMTFDRAIDSSVGTADAL
jgi:branched-chain amino acid transport system substrate-binding protein